MRALLALIMRGRAQAMTAAAVCAALSLLFPPLSYASGAVIGLATLRQGAREGALVIGGSVLLCGVFAFLVAGTPAPALAFLAMSWLPAWLVAAALAATRSQGVALLASAGLGALAVVAMHLALGDPARWWRDALGEFFAPALESAGGEAGQRLVEVLDVWAPRMTRYFGAAVTGGVTLSVLLARWGHSVLDNPGGFGQEFRTLDVGRVALGVCLVLVAVGLFAGAPGTLIGDLVGPVTVVLMFQGLAVAHGVVRNRGLARGWLVAMYVLLVVPPHLAVSVLAVTGLLDGWLGLRARAGSGSS